MPPASVVTGSLGIKTFKMGPIVGKAKIAGIWTVFFASACRAYNDLSLRLDELDHANPCGRTRSLRIAMQASHSLILLAHGIVVVYSIVVW